ncbi:COG4705 family protein [Mycobacterium sp. NPDC004974]
MTETTRNGSGRATRVMVSKVPEITVWFWVIKILCTTVGESFADWINMSLGVGLIATALIFTVVLAAVLIWQLRLERYVPFVYWLTVVVLSVAGTLYTDILTDTFAVPLAVSASVVAAALAVVFAVWFARERTLSIHSIVTTPRELFYWLAVLVTFALGTAVGDWVLQLTGWGPGVSVLLPAALIGAVLVGWRCGANSVLSFWLAYILTRPLGANLGDWFATPATEHGLGLGTALTSVIFLAAIAATVLYLTRSRVDVIAATAQTGLKPPTVSRPAREHAMLGYFGVVAAVTGALLVWAAGQPHQTAAAGEEDANASTSVAALSPEQVTAHFPAADIATFRTIAEDTLTKLRAGDQTGATVRIKDLETAWDERQGALQPMDVDTWTGLDGQIDGVLTALRAAQPDPATEKQSLDALLASLS